MNKNDDDLLCLNVALRYLELQPRSEQEVREYLVKKQKFNIDSINKAMSRLKAANLVNDLVFAELWSKSRNDFKPKSRNMVRYELVKKGIDQDVAEQATSQLDDMDNAFKLGIKKAALIKYKDYKDFYRRLSGYLARRGFNQETISAAIKNIWQQLDSCSKECD